MSISKSTRNVAGIILAATISATPLTAVSQERPACGDREGILTHLEEKYSEAVVSMGLDASGRMLEVIAAPSGTWTILVTVPGGLTCLISSGVAWESMYVPPGQSS